MARQKVILNGRGVHQLLKDPGVTAHLEGLMGPVLATAVGTAPVETGDYVRSLGMTTVGHRTRTVVRVGATSDHALAVEARHGTLSRALDASGGRR